MEVIRNFQIIVVSAENLDDIRHLGAMKVYAKVSLYGEKHTTKKTNVDLLGGVNPSWNFPVNYTISESAFTGDQKPLTVVVKLYCARMRGKKFLGQVEISAQRLFSSWVGSVGEHGFTVAGTRDGRLNIRFDFSEPFPYWYVEPDQTEQQSAWKRAIKMIGQMVLKYGIWFFLSTDFDDITAI
ncbi:hypothetical protein SASPL_150735 [Salvia splendens]|uniref:C2 domain-containing protein n=1 Tax=Salvia splendens TaxID=180675 RepID=A0A8X8W735_SALSN|nr:protein SRC2-like [Salvia splendens]KAG6389270.1 hypothetical protein SASPL_150735 [Salvia splendens]